MNLLYVEFGSSKLKNALYNDNRLLENERLRL